MERMRKPFQGIWNIIRFNWDYYLFSVVLVLLILIFSSFLTVSNSFWGIFVFIEITLCILIVGTTFISLFVSFYVYDLSGLYKLNWMDDLKIVANSKIININAGFDETSILLKAKFPDSELIVMDFYDPLKHTELSIGRARKAYPSFPGTKQVSTTGLPLRNNDVDTVFVILSAHEIRSEDERTVFFSELKRSLKTRGNIVVTEHLRDLPNFLAYNIGFFHFISLSSWHRTFKNAGLTVSKEIKITPFITTFILEKYGVAS